MRCIAERRIYITEIECELGGDVVFKFIMRRSSTRLGRGSAVRGNRQGLVFDLIRSRIFGEMTAISDNNGDGFADKANLFGRQWFLGKRMTDGRVPGLEAVIVGHACL